jgi:hypothetical protein
MTYPFVIPTNSIPTRRSRARAATTDNRRPRRLTVPRTKCWVRVSRREGSGTLRVASVRRTAGATALARSLSNRLHNKSFNDSTDDSACPSALALAARSWGLSPAARRQGPRAAYGVREQRRRADFAGRRQGAAT